MSDSSHDKRRFRRALDVLTEGKEAPMAEEVRLEAVDVHERSLPWTQAGGIQGFGIAERITRGEKLDELALKVYVEQKLPESRLDNPVPPKVNVPGFEGQVETDVEEIGRVELELNTTRHRPAMPSCGLGHEKVTVGTFGCLVRKRGQAEPLYVLSNAHVLANYGVCEKGDVVLQAGPHDGGLAPGDRIAELEEWVPFDFAEEGFPNLVDAAIARVSRQDVSSRVPLIGVPRGHSTFVRRGMRVQKNGRTTDLTFGEIKDTDYRLPMSYPKPDGGKGRVGLRDQVLCTRFTAGGDSGSAVFNTRGKIVGLHFAGSSSTSIFNRIGHVLDLLEVEVVTEEF